MHTNLEIYYVILPSVTSFGYFFLLSFNIWQHVWPKPALERSTHRHNAWDRKSPPRGGHALLKKKSDALTVQFRQILKKIYCLHKRINGNHRENLLLHFSPRKRPKSLSQSPEPTYDQKKKSGPNKKMWWA